MPRVPMMEPGVPSTGITPSARFDAPRAVNSAAEQSARMGQALEGAANLAGKVELDAKALVDRPIYDEAVTQGLSLQLELESGGAGFMHAQGKDALFRESGKPLGAEYDEVYASRLQEIRDGLPNEAVKSAFDRQIPVMRRALRAKADAHMVKQQDAYNISVQQGKAEVGGRLVTDHFDDPERWSMGRAGVADAVRQLNRGMDADAVDGEIRKALTPLHQQVIQRMVDAGNVSLARDYFAKPEVMAEMTDEAKTRVSGALTVAAMEIEGQQAARETVSGLGDAWSLKQADEALVAKLGSNPKALQEARQELSRMDVLRKDARAADEDALLSPLQRLQGDADSAGRIITDAERRSVLSPLRLSRPDLYAKGAAVIAAHNEQVRARNDSAKRRAEELSSGERGANAINLKFDMMSNPDKYRNADMGQVVAPLVREGKITAEAGNGLLGMWEKMRKPDGGDQFSTITTADAYLQNRLRGSMISVNGSLKKYSDLDKKDQQEVLSKARTNLDAYLISAQAGSGKFNDQQVREVVDGLFTNTAIRDTFLGIGVGGAKPAVKANIDAYNGAVPAGDRVRIIAAMRRAGLPITEESIAAIYQQGKNK